MGDWHRHFLRMVKSNEVSMWRGLEPRPLIPAVSLRTAEGYMRCMQLPAALTMGSRWSAQVIAEAAQRCGEIRVALPDGPPIGASRAAQRIRYVGFGCSARTRPQSTSKSADAISTI